MSARRTRGGDLKDPKEEEGGEEAVAMAVAETTSEMAMGSEAVEAALETLNAESSRDSKRLRVSTKEASNEFLDSAKSSSEVSGEADTTSSIDRFGDSSAGAGAVDKVGEGTVQRGAAAGQASMSESTVHSASEASVDDAPASAYHVGALGSGESVGDAASTGTAAASYKSVISSLAQANVNESNFIKAENYYLLHWLYRIRRAGCARGLRIGFLQPDFLWSMYKPMMRRRRLWRTDGDIRSAADLWCFDRATAEERYGHISEWDVSSVTDTGGLFAGQGDEDEDEDEPWEDRHRGKDLFNDDISRWDVSSVADMIGMFSNSRAFNQPVGNWDVSKVTDMSYMFAHAQCFNQSVGDWDVSKVTDMGSMFCEARAFNQSVGDWDVSKVTNTNSMFDSAESFNQPVGALDVSKVTDMRAMFCDARAFNQSVGDWDVSKVAYMSYMFCDALAFNQAIGNWDVSKVTNMSYMFNSAWSFNQSVGDWDVSNVTKMIRMFEDAARFNQDLTRWDMSSVEDASNMFRHADAMQRDNKPAAVRDDVYVNDA